MRKSRKQAQGRPVGRADSQDAGSRAGPEPEKPGSCTREDILSPRYSYRAYKGNLTTQAHNDWQRARPAAGSRAGPEPIKPGNCTREGTTRLQRAGRDRNLKSPVAVPERIYYPQGIATELTKEISPPRHTTIGSGHRPPGTARRAPWLIRFSFRLIPAGPGSCRSPSRRRW